MPDYLLKWRKDLKDRKLWPPPELELSQAAFEDLMRTFFMTEAEVNGDMRIFGVPVTVIRT